MTYVIRGKGLSLCNGSEL